MVFARRYDNTQSYRDVAGGPAMDPLALGRVVAFSKRITSQRPENLRRGRGPGRAHGPEMAEVVWPKRGINHRSGQFRLGFPPGPATKREYRPEVPLLEGVGASHA
jgi:hypothetical protein